MTTKQSNGSSGGATGGRSIGDPPGTIASEARRVSRRAVSLRLVLLAIAAVSLLFATVKQAPESRDLRRRILASQKLIVPLITWHELQADGNRLTEREELELVRSRSKRLREELRRTARSVARTGVSFRVPPEVRDLGKYLKSLTVKSSGHAGPTVLENYQTSVWSSLMASYHDHMKSYYEKLLSELWTELPPTPASLEAELRAREVEIRCLRQNPAVELNPVTAPHLRHGAPKPKVPLWDGSGPDSF